MKTWLRKYLFVVSTCQGKQNTKYNRTGVLVQLLRRAIVLHFAFTVLMYKTDNVCINLILQERAIKFT